MRHKFTRTNLPTVLLALTAVVVLTTAVHARTPVDETQADRRIQEARQAAALGSIDEAVDIYTEILEADPGNERAFWGLVGIYSSAGMEEDALIPLLERRIREKPYDTQAKMELGRAHAVTGNHDVAHELWSDVLENGTANAGRYSDIGSLEMRHRMYAQALETFTAGREVFRNETLYSQELTQIHTALGDFTSAIDECFIAVDSHGGAVAWATNRIELMLEEGADRREVRSRMADVAEDDDATVDRLGLAGSVFLVLDLPERALDTFLRADEISGGEGRELLGYAEILRGEGRDDLARDAYLMTVERHSGTASAARAGAEGARLLASAGDPAGAVAELRSVADIYDGLSWGAQALFEAARIELDDLGDPGAALATIEQLRDRFGVRARKMNEEATLIEVDAYMMQGRLDEAYDRSGTLIGEDTPGDVRERAMFARGFVSFLRHDHDRATEEFRAMVKADAAGALVNDALRLMLAVAGAEEAGDMVPVNMLADAHAARITGDDESSLGLLMELAGGNAGEAVRTEALLLLGAGAVADGEARRAIAYYDRIISEAAGITARAEAMMRKADILWLTMEEDREAADQYLAILEDLPANVLSGEARRKLDVLRRGGIEG